MGHRANRARKDKARKADSNKARKAGSNKAHRDKEDRAVQDLHPRCGFQRCFKTPRSITTVSRSDSSSPIPWKQRWKRRSW